jgi:hypothetical protein
MFIFYGKKSREEDLGSVADWCDACGKVRKCQVVKYYEVDHVYGISLGGGSYLGTVRECWRCGAQYYCKVKRYAELVSEEEAQALPVAELLRLTNPDLERKLNPSEPAGNVLLCPKCRWDLGPLPLGGITTTCPRCGCQVTIQ